MRAEDDMGLGGMTSWHIKMVKWPYCFQNIKHLIPKHFTKS
jgi:hypothetical protein